VIISSDNPKNEDPVLIAEEILSGAKQYSAACTVMIDREEQSGTG
jgi:UDP-N-acetylmuramyl tripeptide synthase